MLSKEHQGHVDKFRMKFVKDRIEVMAHDKIDRLVQDLTYREKTGQQTRDEWEVSDLPLIRLVREDMIYNF